MAKNQQPTKKDREWQKKIEKNVKKEEVDLNQPHGAEKFVAALKKIIKPKK